MVQKTENEDAEEFSAYSLNTTPKTFKSEEVTLYGVRSDSKYIKINLKDEKADLQENSKITADVYISSAYADKFSLKPGDAITLKEKYEKESYTFRVKGIYAYNGGLCIFMNQNQLNRIFDLGSDYYSGYFSDTEITDISSKYIGSVIDLNALTKISRQLDVSMGNMMGLVNGFAIAIFLVLIYLLSKIIIEKNAQSISMVKILGYNNGEISRLYISIDFHCRCAVSAVKLSIRNDFHESNLSRNDAPKFFRLDCSVHCTGNLCENVSYRNYKLCGSCIIRISKNQESTDG